MPLKMDLHPSPEEERKHKKQHLVQSPNYCFMYVKCPGCYKITTVSTMHKWSFCTLTAPLSSASLQKEKRGLQKDVPSGGSSTQNILTQEASEKSSLQGDVCMEKGRNLTKISSSTEQAEGAANAEILRYTIQGPNQMASSAEQMTTTDGAMQKELHQKQQSLGFHPGSATHCISDFEQKGRN
ncbi:40S ribosomal protein S27 [Tupaia chinensis]|uniref:40S ribosomal protein S27 n=1 Tax=Tupaia chinensis TaxID=246437 RepID=L9L6T6_TUPCH|nr:40S ribosomal protein S27 [Tupaia chinensis]